MFLRRIEHKSNALVCLWIIVVFMLAPCAMRSQTQAPAAASAAQDWPPPIEVSTVKPARNSDGKTLVGRGDARCITPTNVSARDLIMFAYGFFDTKRIEGAPKWIENDHYDIVVQLPEGVDSGRLHSPKGAPDVLKELLADRFKLKFHQEQRMMPAYILTVAKGGPKLKVSDPSEAKKSSCKGNALMECTWRNESFSDFISLLNMFTLNMPIIDKTGLTGNYDFDMKWVPDESETGSAMLSGLRIPTKDDSKPAEDPNGSSLSTAFKEQLGLKLESKKVMTDVLVIDHIEQPEPN